MAVRRCQLAKVINAESVENNYPVRVGEYDGNTGIIKTIGSWEQGYFLSAATLESIQLLAGGPCRRVPGAGAKAVA